MENYTWKRRNSGAHSKQPCILNWGALEERVSVTSKEILKPDVVLKGFSMQQCIGLVELSYPITRMSNLQRTYSCVSPHSVASGRDSRYNHPVCRATLWNGEIATQN